VYITSPETSAAVIPVAIEFMSDPLSSALWASCQVFFQASCQIEHGL